MPNPFFYPASQVKAVRFRESAAPPPRNLTSPLACAQFWAEAIATQADYTPDQERFVVLHMDTRRFVTGWHLVSLGTLDSTLVHAREIYRTALVAAAHSIILMHNHPSGDPTPSEADIRTTRDMIRAGQLLRIEVLDHVIVGEYPPEHRTTHHSLRESGHFYS